jgi:biopolymer transport protein ExbD
LLVLLVIFMVITPLTPQGFEASIPHQAAFPKQQRPEANLILSLDRNGGVQLNRETLDLASLLPRLREIFSTRADRTLFVQADDEILFNEVARLIDTARGSGASRIGLITTRNP